MKPAEFFFYFFFLGGDFDVFLSEKEKIQILLEIVRPNWTVLDVSIWTHSFHEEEITDSNNPPNPHLSDSKLR